MSGINPDDAIQVRSKIWLEVGGEPVFGRGREDLLHLIQNGNSINAAAKAMGIPYRKAWTYIDSMEKRLGFPLVTRCRGGAGGGASSLTPRAAALLEKFRLLREGFNDSVNSWVSDLDF